MDDQNKNLILATALSFLVILVWYMIFPPEQPVTDPNAPVATETGAQTLAPPATADAPASQGAAQTAEAVETAPRVTIETPRLAGSISLVGGRIDDLALKDYREELDADSALVDLLRPAGQANAYYAVHGWVPGGSLDANAVPGPNTLWSVEGARSLTPEQPITLVWDNGEGLRFEREISVDADYMFTIRQSVSNSGSDSVRLAPYGRVARHGQPDTVGFFILHEGVVRQTDNELAELDYGDFADLGRDQMWGPNTQVTEAEANGWIGFTDKYWMTTLIPEPGTPFTSAVQYVASQDIYQVFTRLPTLEVAPGVTASSETQLFAGAKEWETIREYEANAGIYRFIDSIDWGWFFFLTKPIFWLLHYLNEILGNMGWSIIALTFVLKALLLPLAYKSYVSMAKMKELQPEMEKLKEQAGDDRQKMQQGMMKLYQDNKVNPAAGCLPILMQIPIFFSLYKVIFVTIELRHAPWLGWITDLSAPDPSSILNLFGLFSWSTPEQGSIFFIFSLGILPILLGISMWLQQKLNPSPTDPTQAMIFAWMPWVFMFMLGSFASGLVLYWITNNTITFIQQYAIMRSHGHKPDVFGNIRRSFQRKQPDAPEAANSAKKPGGKPGKK
ncbi:MAG: membrane protein insertase YidC [Rhodobacteraceae bacterium]|nr:membrane protein insertase YidC [Paracoccaceae bacterium]